MVRRQVRRIDFFPDLTDDHELLVLPETLIPRSVYPRLAHGTASNHIRPEDEPDISVESNLLQDITCRGVLTGLQIEKLDPHLWKALKGQVDHGGTVNRGDVIFDGLSGQAVPWRNDHFVKLLA